MTIYDWGEAHLGIPRVFQATFLAIGLLSLAGWSLRRSLRAARDPILPDGRITLRDVLELVVEALATLMWQTIGPEWKKWFPLVATLFFFILTSNLIGLLPGVEGATTDMNANVAWAILVFAAYHHAGVRKHGWRYVYQFMGPSLFTVRLGRRKFGVRALAPLMIPIEFLLHSARVVTLSVRLAANMFADHTVVAVWLSLVPIAVPAAFLGLGLLVSVLQAFVFTLLAMIYIGMALEESH